MRKRIVILLILICMLLMSSCTMRNARTHMLDMSTDDEVADERMEQIVEAIKNEDKEALKSLFSENAITESEDFDGSMSELFEFIQGDIESWEQSDDLTVKESNDHGHVTKLISSYPYISTDQQKYSLLIDDYPEDTDHPENVGIYLLVVVKIEDEYTIFDGEKKILLDGKEQIPRVGIYLPFK